MQVAKGDGWNVNVAAASASHPGVQGSRGKHKWAYVGRSARSQDVYVLTPQTLVYNMF